MFNLWNKPSVLSGLIICIAVQACASQHTVALRYLCSGTNQQTETFMQPSFLCVTVFNDARQTQDQSIIGKRFSIDGVELPVYCRPLLPAYAVALTLREHLFGNNFTVYGGIPFWDLEEQTIDPAWGTVVIGGDIQNLDVVCAADFWRTHYTVTFKLAIVVADVRRRKIVYTTTVQSASVRSDFLFSEERLEQEINRNLSSAVESLFSDKAFRETLRVVAQGHKEFSLQ